MNGGAGRFEYKYFVNTQTAALLVRQLSALMGADSHGDAAGRYFIRSLYFDDSDNTAYSDKLAGVAARTKYRIRFYNMDASYIMLEAKRRDNRRVYKDAARLSAEDARLIAAGLAPRDGLSNALLSEFVAARSARVLRPRVVVDYDRTAFFHPAGHTRVTLDTHVCTGFRTECFLEHIPTCPVMDAGEGILEVKFDRFLPPHIADILSTAPKVLLANSKYCRCLALQDS